MSDSTQTLDLEVAERIVRAAGFTQFKMHDFEDPGNLYYEVRA